jgi:pimeloyl-ACP methyl ester carboxylesterase
VRNRKWMPACVAIAAGVMATMAATPPATAAPSTSLTSLVTKLSWGHCPNVGAPYQCAAAPVPLNYADPSGTKITLELIKLPAAKSAERIGSLFINFGGPGGNGVGLLPTKVSDGYISQNIRDHFDLVSWDTRGTGLSTAVHCFPSATADSAYFNSVPYFPYPASTDASFWSLSAQLGQDCKARAASLLPHMSSQDTARDLDLLRQDVGDSKLNYLGYSYGSFIGEIYANLFPGNIRAMVLDGTVDPKGNAVGDALGDSSKYPVDVRNGVDLAARGVFTRFLSLCAKAGSGKCPFAADGNLLGKWQTLLTRAKAHPIVYSGGTYFYDTIVAVTYYNLYKPITEWPALGDLLQGLYTASASDRSLNASGPTYNVNNGNEGYDISQCADILVPTNTSVYDKLAVTENAKVPDWGMFVTYDMNYCASWPALHTDAYDGPWNRSRTTILAINSRYDPATPYAGAQAAVKELGNARLLTVNGDGHTSEYSEPSPCRDAAKDAYLISLKLPAVGAVCQVSQLPWGLPAGR